MPYGYPPSEDMLRYGQLQDGVHFYVKGIAFLRGSHPHRVRCTFEVGYTTECQIIAVCYPEITLSEQILRKMRDVYLLVGNDLKTGVRVLADGLSLLRSEEKTFGSVKENIILTFEGDYLGTKPPKIPAIGDTSNYIYFYDIVGIELREYLDPNSRFFDPTHQGQVVFPTEDSNNKSLILLFRKTFNQRRYNNQPTACLAVPPNCVPTGWRADIVADTWCRLMSLGMGLDIQWTSRYIRYTESPGTVREQKWASRKIYTERPLHSLISRFIAKDDIQLQIFVKKIFVNLMKGMIDQESVMSYLSAIRDYIDYLNVDTRYLNGQIRLIATLTEQLLYGWESFHKTKFEHLINKTESSNLEKVIEQALQREANTPNDYLISFDSKNKREKLIDRVKRLVHNQVNFTPFSDRLDLFFRNYHHHNKQLDLRIKAFIETRNSIAHRGALAWQDNEVDKNRLVRFFPEIGTEWYHECNNLFMMLPLMVLSIFGYEGPYNDLLYSEQKQVWTPDSETTENT